MPRDPMTLDEFRLAFARVKNLGYVRATRSGPTGVGHTFETLLGLKKGE
ncbi:hypothetical protein BH18ACI2_BH18ACI2_29240 [soil metagenome]